MKKLFGVILILAIVAIAAINMNFNEKNKLSAFALANIDALANSEIKSGDPCYNNTRYNVDYPSAVVCGTPCKYEKSVLLSTSRSKCE